MPLFDGQPHCLLYRLAPQEAKTKTINIPNIIVRFSFPFIAYF